MLITKTRPRPLQCSGHVARIAVRVPAAACLFTAALVLSGCGGSSPRPQVASLPTHGSVSSHHSAFTTSTEGVPDPDGRPRQPLNATKAQQEALYSPYYACLRAHNIQFGTRATLAVLSKCERHEPLPPWQFDPSNPQARVFIGRTVTCLLAKGDHARADLITNIPEQAPEWFITFPADTRSAAIAQDGCQQQALR
jgi:hypothetical protein